MQWSYSRNLRSGFNWRKLGKLLKVLKVDAKSVNKGKRFKAKSVNDSGKDELGLSGNKRELC